MADRLSPGTAVLASSPSRHLLVVIADALQLPDPAATADDELAYLQLLSRRAGLALHACRQALAGQSDGAVLNAASDLFTAVSNAPATCYSHAAACRPRSR